jgi:hypothetical protein
MNPLLAQLRAVLWWLVPLVTLLALIGWEIDWGAEVRKRPPAEEPIPPKPVAAAVLPDYVIEGGIASRAETVDRTLFNPTRRPAPVAVAEAAKPRMQRGMYTLTGTTLAGDRSLAFLKEVSGGKARTVKQGDKIGSLLVAEVGPDRVKLALGDETEELMLKVVTNPKPTPQPAATAGTPGGATPGVPGAAPAIPARGQPPTAAATAAPQPAEAGQTLAERRRAARAAEAAAAAAAAAPAAPAAAGSARADPAWQAMEDRYQRRSAGQRK